MPLRTATGFTDSSQALLTLVSTAALCILAVLPAHALEVRRSEGETSTITIPADETVDDTLVVVGDAITIDGTVTGNLIALGRRVDMNGKVQGDLICGAQRVLVAGEVDGNVLAFGRGIDLRGTTGQSVHTFGEDIRFEDTARTGGDIMAFGSELGVGGIVGRDALVFAGSTDIQGTVGRHMTSRSGVLTVTESARIGGNLTAHTNEESKVRIAPGAAIGGRKEVELRDETDEDEESNAGAVFIGAIVWKLCGIAAAFVTGLALFWCLPAAFTPRMETSADLVRTMGIGFLCLVATPVAAVLLMVTLIGLPLGLLTLLCWMTALYIASIIVAAIVGSRMLRKPLGTLSEFAIALLVGLIVLALATSVPLLGVIVRFLAVLCGLGLLWKWTLSTEKATSAGPVSWTKVD